MVLLPQRNSFEHPPPSFDGYSQKEYNLNMFRFLWFFVLSLFLVSCRAEIETHVIFSEIKLPLTGFISPYGGSIEFYVQKEFDIYRETDISLDEIVWSYRALSRGTISYEVKISSTGVGEEGLFATCNPENLCSRLPGNYGSTPEYVRNAPVIFSGSINGGVHEFSNIRQNRESLEELERSIENGKIWVILKVTASDPSQFLQGDTLIIRDLRGDIKLHKNLDYFFPFSGLLF